MADADNGDRTRFGTVTLRARKRVLGNGGRKTQALSENDNIERVRHVVMRKVGERWQEALRPNRDKRIRAICVNISLIAVAYYL